MAMRLPPDTHGGELALPPRLCAARAVFATQARGGAACAGGWNGRADGNGPGPGDRSSSGGGAEVWTCDWRHETGPPRCA